MNITTGYEPKCCSCVDYYNDECQCPKSIYSGMSIPAIPWEGCPCFISQRKLGGNDKQKRKRKSKWPTMAEFEFGM